MEEINNKIKSFIYLDENKMFSISSQLFEGITKYILQEDTTSYEEQNEQKGQFLSGRFMADMMFQGTVKSEMKYLHDFAFNLFEKELISRGLLYEVKSTDDIASLRDKGFVKITGQILFSDYGKMRDTIEHFNELGRAFGEIQFGGISQEMDEAIKQNNQIKDREKKNKQNQAIKAVKSRIDEYLKEAGLILSDQYIKNLSTIMQYGYRDNYEIRLNIPESELYCTAIINHTYLKEPEQILVSRYSRLTEKQFTIIGILTQVGNDKTELLQPTGNDMKNATQGFTTQIANIEEQFNGRCTNEFIVDPIAIFTEL